MRVLVVDSDPISRAVLRGLLTKWGYDVIEATDGIQALGILQSEDAPGMALLDWMMPGMDGIDLCRQVRQAPTDYQYIILLTNRDSKADIVCGLNAGVDDYITKPYLPQELQGRLMVGKRILSLQRSLQESVEAQRYQAQHDPLTGLYNHGEILNILDQEIGRADRGGSTLTVIMGDLDHFKRVNDTFGHVAGDAVLADIAERLSNSLRLYDSIGRYGGEEFLLVLPGCSREEAIKLADRILTSVRSRPVLSDGQEIAVTISLGLSFNHPGTKEKMVDLVQAADAALYRAKDGGRNRFECSEI